MPFVFIDPAATTSVGTSTTALATDTTGTGGQVGVAKVVPPGLDEQSPLNAAAVNAYTSQAMTQLTDAGLLQENYGGAILISSQGYTQTDSLNATGLGVQSV